MRAKQPEGTRGSLKWIQRAVSDHPELLQPGGLPPIRWISPLSSDDYAEYRDGAFLDCIGQSRLRPALAEFWPARGPQWDALGLAGSDPILVEAKAHVREFLSPPTQAGPKSRERIAAAFSATKAGLGADERSDWTRCFYQLANRIAHLWWLRSHGVSAHLLLVGFLNDTDMNGPGSAETWHAVTDAAFDALGLSGNRPLSKWVHHVTPDVRALT